MRLVRPHLSGNIKPTLILSNSVHQRLVGGDRVLNLLVILLYFHFDRVMSIFELLGSFLDSVCEGRWLLFDLLFLGLVGPYLTFGSCCFECLDDLFAP